MQVSKAMCALVSTPAFKKAWFKINEVKAAWDKQKKALSKQIKAVDEEELEVEVEQPQYPPPPLPPAPPAPVAAAPLAAAASTSASAAPAPAACASIETLASTEACESAAASSPSTAGAASSGKRRRTSGKQRQGGLDKEEMEKLARQAAFFEALDAEELEVEVAH